MRRCVVKRHSGLPALRVYRSNDDGVCSGDRLSIYARSNQDDHEARETQTGPMKTRALRPGMPSGSLPAPPERRVADLHAMFHDPEIRAILTTVGGDHSCQLLPHLDFELIRRNPKIFMGYSDITVLNLAIAARTDLVTFNGP